MAAGVVDVTDYDAKGDAHTLNTAAIHSAIDACHAAGGGTVHFPPGDFLTGTIVLKSRVTLRLAPGATLWGSTRIEDYAPRHLIYALDAEDIAIEGGGVINGNGPAYWDADFRPISPRPGTLIELVGCRNVRIQDVCIRNAPAWTIHPLRCDGVWIRGVSIVNDLRGPNTDGIDPDSSRNVMISDCYIEAGDDCIVLKTTGRHLPPGAPVPPTENVTVTNCTLISRAAALKLGTESHGDIRHCVFSNCVIRDTRVGLALYGKDGGTFEAIRFSNITIDTRSERGGAEWPIIVDLERRRAASRPGRVRDVVFAAAELPLEDITFRDITLRVMGSEPVEGVRKPRGARLTGPLAPAFDYASIPAAFILANIERLTLHDVRVEWDPPEAHEADTPEAKQAPEPSLERHAIYAASVDGLMIDGFAGRQAVPNGHLAAIALEDVRDVSITASTAAPGTGVFVASANTPPHELTLHANNLRHAHTERQADHTSVHPRRRLP